MPLAETLFGTPHPVALVTGSGAPRVGQTVLRRLAERGYRVVVHANRAAEAARGVVSELVELGGEATFLVGDLTDEDVARRVVREAAGVWGRLDVLVNAAAIWERKPLEQVTAADVMRHFQVNALSVFVLCQEAGQIMATQAKGGAIVNVGDWATIRPYRDYAAYFPSKGAIPTVTRLFAVELAARNPRIRVNAVLPGPVMLPPDLPEDERRTAIAATLVKREGNADNVARAAIALIENDFITGVCLPVDGGRSVFAPEPFEAC